MNDVTATLAPRGLIAAYGRTPLRSALTLDAAVTFATAVAYLAAAGPLGDLLGLPPALLRGTGAFLLAFACAVGAVATRSVIARGAVYAIVLANLGWTAASVAAAGAGLALPDDRRDDLDPPAGRRRRRLRRAAVGGAEAGAVVSIASSATVRPAIGTLLKDWRRRRRRSQYELALDAGVSARHLSFVETGRSRPSAEMIVRLAEQLDVPLRERNQMLLAGGYAPVYGQRDLQDPQMGPVRDAIDRVLAGHDPYPAVVVDRHWGMIAANRAIALLTEGVAEHLLEPPVNVLRLGLHPDGLAARIVNHGEWRAHLLDRLYRQSVASADPALAALHAELAAYPVQDPGPSPHLTANEIAVALRLAHDRGELTFISTVATFGTAADITMSELTIESFYPADAATAEFLHAWARRGDG